ncbi:hypothetical protein Ngar_c25970 [Candidatus Nitrososphaera gargensis Ga9.2]|uniref:Uncharacterized protein n=1 Tax=Nitrososphaera gargensis (strain Ga9.2) TaxID=1237085 RepID=K0INK2_NITGG|nr:hypothetical protein [Candidatus Nitrososphaera gargensis]AFU59519.1 hypothetical protein Ngar_c25970 [Candidatus Nitrososphaera gargensis Ga9.2]
MLRQAAIHNKDTSVEQFAKGLGIRLDKLVVLNEKDCIKIKPKGWLEKKEWREINDILRMQGFNWLANDKNSCWIKT